MIQHCEDLTIELKSGKVVTVEVNARAYFDFDYGADADGRFGYKQLIVDTIDYDTPDRSDEGEPLTKKEIVELIDALEAAAHNFPFEDIDELDDWDDSDDEDLSDTEELESEEW